MHLFLIHVFHHHTHGVFEIVDVQSLQVFVIKRLCYQLFNFISAAANVIMDFIGINNAFFFYLLNQNNQLPIRSAASRFDETGVGSGHGFKQLCPYRRVVRHRQSLSFGLSILIVWYDDTSSLILKIQH